MAKGKGDEFDPQVRYEGRGGAPKLPSRSDLVFYPRKAHRWRYAKSPKGKPWQNAVWFLLLIGSLLFLMIVMWETPEIRLGVVIGAAIVLVCGLAIRAGSQRPKKFPEEDE